MIERLVKPVFEYLKILCKWIIISLAVGAAGGVIGSIFHISIDMATELRENKPLIILLLPVGGLVIAALYALCRRYGHINTNRVILSVQSEESVPLVMAPLIFVSTVITHLLGGSAGREGAALQLGGSIGYNTGKVLRLNKGDMHIIVMSGMSAVFAALFGTPLTATVFALEVTNVGVIHYAGLVPCIISSVVASGIALKSGLHPVKFTDTVMQGVSPEILSKAIVLAILCAVVSIIFCTAIGKGEHYFKKLIPNIYLRAFAGGVAVVILTFALRTYDYNGTGMGVITNALGGNARPEAFALKIVFTVVTIAAGFKGGEIVPAFFIGSTFGCVMGSVLGLEPGFGAALGFVALFCSVVNCPIASVMLALEVFGSESILVFAVVCAVSYMMSGYFGLYSSQKIAYSKLNEDFLDINTKH